jgi:hypothetical protein
MLQFTRGFLLLRVLQMMDRKHIHMLRADFFPPYFRNIKPYKTII